MSLPKPPSFDLSGKSALVTGAGRGIGFAAAVVLAQHGADVTLAARTRDEIEAGAAEIRAAGGKAQALVLDVTDIAATKATLEAGPAYDILVNNAGTNRPGPFTEVSLDAYDVVMNLNVRAAFFVAQTVAARMLAEKKAGSIIHMSSQMGHVGGANRTLYCASKWAIEGLSKAMAVELGPHNIRSNTLCPTFIETQMTRPYLTEPTFRASVIAKIKLGRLGQVDDLTGPLLLLASDAGGLMTGASLLVDGGWTAG